MRTCLVKIGGSLLTLPDLPQRLELLLDQLAEFRIMLLIGGGTVADAVRNWDRIHQLDTSAAHWLAIDAMGLTTSLVSQLVDRADVVSSRHAVQWCWTRNRLPILQPGTIVGQFAEESSDDLPEGWHVTSDAIAGWCATWSCSGFTCMSRPVGS